MREILVIAAVVLTTLSTSAGAQSTAAPQDSLAIARRFAEWFFTSQKDSLWAHSSDDLKGQMKSPDEWTTALEQLAARAAQRRRCSKKHSSSGMAGRSTGAPPSIRSRTNP